MARTIFAEYWREAIFGTIAGLLFFPAMNGLITGLALIAGVMP